MTTERLRLVGAAVLCVLLHAPALHAADRYALVITGASAGPAYAEKYDGWRNHFVSILTGKLGYPGDHVMVLAETESALVKRSTRENVRAALAALRTRVASEDTLLVVLIGHGTAGEGDEAKFNLVGPDLKSSDWADLLKGFPGRLVFVDTTAASFPFLRRMAAPNRVVMTATDSAAQQFETIFAEFFIKAFDDPAADADKNGRLSMWEAFEYASRSVRQWFDRNGQLPTERALLDDNGDGVGREVQSPGADGPLARTVYLAPEAAGAGDPELVARRAALERQLDDVRSRKAASPNPSQFDAEIEKLLIEIARMSRQLR